MLNEELQRRMLQHMLENMPDGAWMGEFEELDPQTLISNLNYLDDLGLCTSGVAHDQSGDELVYPSRITAKGADFISQDGGLSAKLNTVTIRLDESTIKQLLAAKIDQAAISETEKKTLKDHLMALSGKGLEALTADLVGKAVDQFPGAIHLLKTTFHL